MCERVTLPIWACFKGGTSKTKLFLNFGPISLKIGYYMQNSKRKRLALSFLRLDPNFLRYSHFCVQKKDFFWFLPEFQSVSPPTIFELEKNFWCHFVPLLTVRTFTYCFFFSISISFSFYKGFCDSFYERSKNRQKCCFFHTFTMITRKLDRNQKK